MGTTGTLKTVTDCPKITIKPEWAICVIEKSLSHYFILYMRTLTCATFWKSLKVVPKLKQEEGKKGKYMMQAGDKEAVCLLLPDGGL